MTTNYIASRKFRKKNASPTVIHDEVNYDMHSQILRDYL